MATRQARNFEVSSLGAVHHVHLAYHDERFIFPPGFQSLRKMKNARGRLVQHTFRIQKGAFAPVFQVEQQGGGVFTDSSATKVLRKMVSAGALPPSRKNVNILFGYAHPEVVPLLQALPGADRLENYCGWSGEKAASLTTASCGVLRRWMRAPLPASYTYAARSSEPHAT